MSGLFDVCPVRQGSEGHEKRRAGATGGERGGHAGRAWAVESRTRGRDVDGGAWTEVLWLHTQLGCPHLPPSYLQLSSWFHRVSLEEP